jgi:hypothetical protein
MGYAPIQTMGKASRKLPKDKREVLRELTQQTSTEDPDTKDVLLLREIFEDHPTLVCELGNVAEMATEHLLNREFSPWYLSETMRAQVQQLKQRMGYGLCPPIEDLIIDNVALCWLRLHVLEYKYTNLRLNEKFTIDQAEWLEKRMDAAQRRFLRATQALARVRKLTRQAIQMQVNIADRQVNQFFAGGEILPVDGGEE